MARPRKPRKAITNRVRFEVFKRDKFTCQYCGKRAPDVVLNVDHIEPVSAGGTSDILNLVTSCFECNSGKSDKKLSDDTAVGAQLDQLAMLQEKRNQLALIKKWLNESGKIQDEYVSIANEQVQKRMGVSISVAKQKEFSAFIKKYGFMELIEAICIASDRYRDVDEALERIGGILHIRDMEKKVPGYGRGSICLGVLRKKFGTRSKRFWAVMIDALCFGVDAEAAINLAKQCKRESDFFEAVEKFLRDQREDEDG